MRAENGYGTLFERLGGQTTARSAHDREASMMASVASHLEKMLGTRAGSVQTLPDYGLPDLNDMRLSLHDALSQARTTIGRFIQAYEPRLSRVEVFSLPKANDPLKLTFAIEGLLEVGGVQRQSSFVAQLDGSGNVTVRWGRDDGMR